MPDVVAPLREPGPARWLLDGVDDWWTFLRFGPPGSETYVRVRLAGDAGQDLFDDVIATLSTLDPVVPRTGMSAVWEGWNGDDGTTPHAATLDVPHRRLALFTGPLDALRFTPSLAWHGDRELLQHPGLVWPVDRSWCIACEVDEQFECAVGCSAAVAAVIRETCRASARTVGYGASLPDVGERR